MTVRELRIEHLSGIVEELGISFGSGGTRGPMSLLLFGDNGTGKSSIVDGLEFALQARVRRVAQPKHVYEALRSHASEMPPRAAVVLESTEELERGFDLEATPLEIVPEGPHPDFSLVPIALRRDDLTRFWETPERQRQVLFRGFFEQPGRGGWMRLGTDEEEVLRRQREERKGERARHLETLAEPLGLLPKQIPLGSLIDFDRFVTDSFAASFGRNWPTSGPSTDPVDAACFAAAVAARRLTREILQIQGKLRSAEAAPLGQTALAEVLTSAQEELSVAFAEISGQGSFIAGIELQSGGIGDLSLRIRVNLVNGRCVSPEEALSEANLDLLAMLIFTSILWAAAEQGQAKLLVLDDVIQSVDAQIRARLLEYLLEHFADWQLVMTTHDRLWHEHVVRAFGRAGKPLERFEIRRWSLLDGPLLANSGGRRRDQLEAALERGGDSVALCGRAGTLLEELCEEMSWRLPVEVRRNRHDRYTLGDLWPAVSRSLKRMGATTLVDDVDRFAHLRNMVGAHYDEAGQTISDAEASTYAGAILVLWDAVNCAQCRNWIKSRPGGRWSCGCGQTVLAPS